MLISLTNNLGGSINYPLETGTPFVLPRAKVMNEVSHLVLLFFLFPKGRGGGGGGGGGGVGLILEQPKGQNLPSPFQTLFVGQAHAIPSWMLEAGGGGGGGGGGGRLDIGATQGTKSSIPIPNALRWSGTRHPFLDARGGGGGLTGTLFIKGRGLRRLPLSTSLDARGATSESSLAKEGCLG